MTKTIQMEIPKIIYVVRQPTMLLKSKFATLPRMSADAPKPIIKKPEQRPFLSGNQALTVAMITL